MSQDAYTVPEFCRAFRVSRTKLYQCWAQNEGPQYYRVGNQRRISADAARDWQQALEARAAETEATN